MDDADDAPANVDAAVTSSSSRASSPKASEGADVQSPAEAGADEVNAPPNDDFPITDAFTTDIAADTDSRVDAVVASLSTSAINVAVEDSRPTAPAGELEMTVVPLEAPSPLTEMTSRPKAVAGGKELPDAVLPGFEKFVIPPYFFWRKGATPRTRATIRIPECPVIVFINSRSGGRLGPKLNTKLRGTIGYAQVFDLSVYKPDVVLRALYERFDELEAQGDEIAVAVRQRLRIVVAGGDGTAAWLLGTLAALGVTPLPPLAVVPLGSGNDLARMFNWGVSFSVHASTRKVLQRVALGTPANLDRWVIRIQTFPNEKALTASPHLPYSFKPVEEVVEDAPLDRFAEGSFWNYFSMGIDARVTHGFHSLREEKPWLFRSRETNQALYGCFWLTQGHWKCTCCTAHRNLKSIAKVRYADAGFNWQELELKPSLQALIVLNLQSYSGGRNPWGKHLVKPVSATRPAKNLVAYEPPSMEDGLLEIVGFEGGWDMANTVVLRRQALRLAQASAIHIELASDDDAREHTFMQIDGEPWMQPIPMDSAEAARGATVAAAGGATTTATTTTAASSSASSAPVPAVPVSTTGGAAAPAQPSGSVVAANAAVDAATTGNVRGADAAAAAAAAKQPSVLPVAPRRSLRIDIAAAPLRSMMLRGPDKKAMAAAASAHK
eukprot:jgi/Mesvir1/27491/Mv07263-RA.1